VVASDDSYLELIGRLATFDPPVHVMGGFAEDAVLHGAVTRPHDDVDVMVDRLMLDRFLAAAAELGFDRFATLFEPVEGIPLVMAASNEDVHLEITVYDRSPEGHVSCLMTDAEGAPIVIDLTPGIFEHPLGRLGGTAIRAVSPLALYQIRAAVIESGAFGPPRPKDVASQEALRDRFFRDDDPSALMPGIAPAR
jgi:hypothetical protein